MKFLRKIVETYKTINVEIPQWVNEYTDTTTSALQTPAATPTGTTSPTQDSTVKKGLDLLSKIKKTPEAEKTANQLDLVYKQVLDALKNQVTTLNTKATDTVKALKTSTDMLNKPTQ